MKAWRKKKSNGKYSNHRKSRMGVTMLPMPTALVMALIRRGGFA